MTASVPRAAVPRVRPHHRPGTKSPHRPGTPPEPHLAPQLHHRPARHPAFGRPHSAACAHTGIRSCIAAPGPPPAVPPTAHGTAREARPADPRSHVRPPTAAPVRRTPPAARQPATDHRGAAGAGIRPARSHCAGRSSRQARAPSTASPPPHRFLRPPQQETAAAETAPLSLCSRQALPGHRPAGASAAEHAPASRSAHATAVQVAGRPDR